MHVTVRFRPDVYGQHYDTLSLHSNDLASQVWIPLKGVSPPPLIEVASPMLTLGPVALGDTVRDVVTIRNRSVANRLTISQIHSQSPAFAAEADAAPGDHGERQCCRHGEVQHPGYPAGRLWNVEGHAEHQFRRGEFLGGPPGVVSPSGPPPRSGRLLPSLRSVRPIRFRRS